MQSPMIQSHPELGKTLSPLRKKQSGYSHLRVCRSEAGYYVGTMWEEYNNAGELIDQAPGSRDSHYFATEAAAAAYLAEAEAENNTFAFRASL